MPSTESILANVLSGAASGGLQRLDAERNREDALKQVAFKQNATNQQLQLQRDQSQRDQQRLNLAQQRADADQSRAQRQSDLLKQVNTLQGNLHASKVYGDFLRDIGDIKGLSNPGLLPRDSANLQKRIVDLIATLGRNGDNVTIGPDGVPIISGDDGEGNQVFLSPQNVAQKTEEARLALPGLFNELDATGFDTRGLRARQGGQPNKTIGFTKVGNTIVKIKEFGPPEETTIDPGLAEAAAKEQLIQIPELDKQLGIRTGTQFIRAVMGPDGSIRGLVPLKLGEVDPVKEKPITKADTDNAVSIEAGPTLLQELAPLFQFFTTGTTGPIPPSLNPSNPSQNTTPVSNSASVSTSGTDIDFLIRAAAQ
jgi:multidrug efflux pump subunit AcrA (membrane-fusion protein)